MNTLYNDMEVSIKDFFIDLFSSFKYDKELIDEQITRDYDRLSLYFNDTKIQKKNNFYFLLQNLSYDRIFKRLLWILPTQATLYPFYYFLHKKFSDNIIAEIPPDYNISNDFKIMIKTHNKNSINVNMFKNFRILKNCNNNIVEVGFIFTEISFMLGNPYNKNIRMKYTIKNI
jgi:hypothetical protein